MIILDTNIFIYLSNGSLDARLIADIDISYASITKIEALGYAQLPANELLLLRSLFAESQAVLLSDAIVDRAVELRQAKRMSLGDSIIAATALEYDSELWTANTQDFNHVDGLRLHDPMGVIRI